MSETKRKPIPDPHCPKCSTQMQLAKTAPFKDVPGIENHTFECPHCGHSEEWIQSVNAPTAANERSRQLWRPTVPARTVSIA
jgi:Zn ribbon nucleic-acid-binding protein